MGLVSPAAIFHRPAVGPPAGTRLTCPGRRGKPHRICVERVKIMQGPYEEMYYHLAKSLLKTENLLSESLTAVSNIPQDMQNKDQITAALLTAQIQTAAKDLQTALLETEELLLNATEETETNPPS